MKKMFCLLLFVSLFIGCQSKKSQQLSCEYDTSGVHYVYTYDGDESGITSSSFIMTGPKADFEITDDNEAEMLVMVREYFDENYPGFSKLDLSIEGDLLTVGMIFEKSEFDEQLMVALYSQEIMDLGLEHTGLTAMQEAMETIGAKQLLDISCSIK
ncbi:MAG: hypothetical protein LBR25_02710 [Erysipelotrichaceae bacterium]|jgi:uncharacterized protein YjfI (DUF2170 family)|nr:hypothetical protein [Erysipelotrichaceae bacterium]